MHCGWKSSRIERGYLNKQAMNPVLQHCAVMALWSQSRRGHGQAMMEMAQVGGSGEWWLWTDRRQLPKILFPHGCSITHLQRRGNRLPATSKKSSATFVACFSSCSCTADTTSSPKRDLTTLSSWMVFLWSTSQNAKSWSSNCARNSLAKVLRSSPIEFFCLGTRPRTGAKGTFSPCRPSLSPTLTQLCLFEFDTTQQASFAINTMNGFQFDAKHRFSVDRFGDIETFARHGCRFYTSHRRTLQAQGKPHPSRTVRFLTHS